MNDWVGRPTAQTLAACIIWGFYLYSALQRYAAQSMDKLQEKANVACHWLQAPGPLVDHPSLSTPNAPRGVFARQGHRVNAGAIGTTGVLVMHRNDRTVGSKIRCCRTQHATTWCRVSIQQNWVNHGHTLSLSLSPPLSPSLSLSLSLCLSPTLRGTPTSLAGCSMELHTDAGWTTSGRAETGTAPGLSGAVCLSLEGGLLAVYICGLAVHIHNMMSIQTRKHKTRCQSTRH